MGVGGGVKGERGDAGWVGVLLLAQLFAFTVCPSSLDYDSPFSISPGLRLL